MTLFGLIGQSKNRSRSPSGMTTRKATAAAKATATATATAKAKATATATAKINAEILRCAKNDGVYLVGLPCFSFCVGRGIWRGLLGCRRLRRRDRER